MKKDESKTAPPESLVIRPRTVQTCGMCTGYLANKPGSKFGACAAMPPVPMLINVVQDMSGKPRPVVDGYRPPVGFDTIRCRDKFEAIDDEHPSLMVDFETQGERQ